MLGIVVSRADSASVHIGEHLRELADWTEHTDGSRPDAAGGGTVYRTDGAELREFADIHIDLDGVDEAFGRVDDPDETTDRDRRAPDLLAFASRHAGETGALLTAHHTGNFGPAEFGGEDRALARAAPNAHSRVLAAFRQHAPEDYEVGTECTHHGPTDLTVPSLFVELGSGERQWQDPEGARAVAKSILDLRGVDPDRPAEGGVGGDDTDGAVDGDGSESGASADGDDTATTADADRRHLAAFGGGHYAPRVERIVRETDWAVGHVAADWSLDDLGDPDDNREVLRRTFEASAATRAVVDGDRPDLKAAIRDLGYEVVGETWVRETDGVPLSLATALETAVRPVADGLRFGDPATGGSRDGSRDGDDAFEVVSLPTELLDEAHGIDPDRTRSTVASRALAFETVENGNRIEGRAAVPTAEAYDGIVDDLAAVLRASYETVEREAGVVRAVETAFDPERARTLGVPDGPKFGALAAGNRVEVDGREIDPEAVHVEREREFSVDPNDE